MIREALEEHARELDRLSKHDRSRTVGASEIGLCARRVCFTKKNHSPTPGHEDAWGAHTRGTIMEKAFWQPAMKAKFGDKLLFSGADQKSIEDDLLSATPDGLLTGLARDCLKHLGIKDIESDCILVECKSIDPRVNLTKAKEENEFQVQGQLGLIRKMTQWKPMYAVISYTDASFWDEIAEYPIRFNEHSFQAAEVRAKMIMQAADPSELKPEGWIAGGSECEYCPFTGPCGVIRRSVPYREAEAAIDPQFKAEIEDMCREVLNLKAQSEKTEAETREKEQAIKDRLREKGVRKISDVVTWSAVKGRSSTNNKALKAAAIEAGVDVTKFETVGEPTDRLQITAIPADDLGEGRSKRR